MLARKVALVTGAGTRVGSAIALACAEAGADVVVHYLRSKASAERLVGQVRTIGRSAVAVCADVTDADQARDLVDQSCSAFGGLDLLVNSAAAFVHAPFVGGTDAAWEAAWKTSFQTNLLAPARLARFAAPILQARHGAIVNIVDVGATLAWPGYAHHTAAKAGLVHLTRTLAIALAPQVRVTGVSPGIAMFPDAMPQARRDALIAKTALSRAGTAQDVAAAVVFLAAQPYATGVVLPIDGGWSVAR